MNLYFFFADLNINQPTEFTIDARAVPKVKNDEVKISCSINNPSGGITEKVITPKVDGTYRVEYTPFEEGPHTIDILYNNIPVPGSPFSVNVKKTTDAGRCRAFGPGLQKGVVNKPNHFTVETKGSLLILPLKNILLLEIFIFF